MTIAPTREQVMAALFAKLNNHVTGIQTYSRRITLPAEVGKLQLPALFLYRLRETIEPGGGAAPPKRHWDVWIVVVFRNTEKTVAGDTILNPILDSIEDALKPSGAGWVGLGNQTLGGLVQQCKIEGELHLEPGDTDPQGLGGAVIPLHIVIP